MNLQEIEKAFGEKFVSKTDVQLCADGEAGVWEDILIPFDKNELQKTQVRPKDVLFFIKNTVIPEVIKELMPNGESWKNENGYQKGWSYGEAIEEIKQKALKSFNLKL